MKLSRSILKSSALFMCTLFAGHGFSSVSREPYEICLLQPSVGGSTFLYQIFGPSRPGTDVMSAVVLGAFASESQISSVFRSSDVQIAPISATTEDPFPIKVQLGIDLACISAPNSSPNTRGNLDISEFDDNAVPSSWVDVQVICAPEVNLRELGFDPSEKRTYAPNDLNNLYRTFMSAPDKENLVALITEFVDPDPFQFKHSARYSQVVLRGSILFPVEDRQVKWEDDPFGCKFRKKQSEMGFPFIMP